jgi:mannobiose 2-epimerase
MEQQFINEATEHILPFWTNLKDLEYGGYYGEVNFNLVVNKESFKGGIAAARILWTFSAMYNEIGNCEYLENANWAYNFFTEHVLDKEYGGVLWMLNHDGEIQDGRKHVYAQSFGIYALVEYYKTCKDPVVLKRAMDLFNLIEDEGFDEEHNCYGEEYNRDWSPKTNQMLSEVGMTAEITTNTLLHILEAYTNLYEVSDNEKVRDRLLSLVNIVIDKIWDRNNNHMRVFFDKEFNSTTNIISYAHDIEATWLMEKALIVLDLEHELKYTNFITSIGEQIYKEALRDDGSILTESNNGICKDNIIWWAQAESIVGFMNLYQRVGDKKYLDAVHLIWKYTNDHVIDGRIGGEWFSDLDENGNPIKLDIVQPWKAPYHNVRMCIELHKRLKV